MNIIKTEEKLKNRGRDVSLLTLSPFPAPSSPYLFLHKVPESFLFLTIQEPTKHKKVFEFLTSIRKQSSIQQSFENRTRYCGSLKILGEQDGHGPCPSEVWHTISNNFQGATEINTLNNDYLELLLL